MLDCRLEQLPDVVERMASSMTIPTSRVTTTRAQRVFISHSHQDAAFSERIATDLIAAGLDVWYDELHMGVGHLAPAIEHELMSRETFLLVLSPAALASQWVQSEWYAAWELLGQDKIRTFIPIIAERCEIPLLLRGMRWIDFTTQPFERALALLVKLLGLSDASASSGVIPDQWGLVTTIRAHPVRGCFAVDWSPDGHKLASGSYDRSVRIWDPATGACLQTLAGHSNGVDAVAWSPDSATLASASLGGAVCLWDTATGQQRALLEGHTGGVVDVAWSPDGHSLVSGSSDQMVRVWDAASGKCRQVLQGHTGPITSVTWSPDGEWIGSTSRDATIRIWQARTGVEAYSLTGHNTVVYCMRWSPDGSMLASSGNTTLRLWDFRRGETLSVLTGHSGYVLRVAWRLDGSLVASASADNTVRLWAAQSGRCVVTLGGHSDWVHDVTWAPSGEALASCGGTNDGTIKIWAPR